MPKSGQYLLITYNISRLRNTNRAKLVYLLKGRRNKHGFIEDNEGRFLAPGCFMIPIKYKQEITQIFIKWNVKYKIITISIG